MAGGNQNVKSNKRIPQGGGAAKYHGSGSKVRGDSRSQNRKLTMELSQGRKDGSMNRKQKVGGGAAAPPKTKEEIQAETVELNFQAKQVHASYQ